MFRCTALWSTKAKPQFEDWAKKWRHLYLSFYFCWDFMEIVIVFHRCRREAHVKVGNASYQLIIHPWLRGWAKLILLTVGWPWLSHAAPIKEGIVCCIRSVSWNIRPWMDLLDILSSPVTWVVTIVSLLYILYRYVILALPTVNYQF